MPKRLDGSPDGLLHRNCHCIAQPIAQPVPNVTAFATMRIEKLTGYAFSGATESGGKMMLFELWGYDIDDCDMLKAEYERQAVVKYANGEYELHSLDKHGQRINIQIDLNGKKFWSGWMVEPKGKIRNITPFGGWKK